MPWESALEQVLRTTYDALEEDGVRWALIGSAASALQGCQMAPRDIDLLAFNPQGVYRVAELMSGYAPSTCGYPPGDENWLSSRELPVVSPAPLWHFGRWLVEGFKVEIAHITAPASWSTSVDGAGIWEAGPEIWPHIQRVSFAAYEVPIVPLEIQLETNLRRALKDRVDQIMAVFQERGYDRALLQKSLSKEHLDVFESQVREKQAWR